MLYARVVDGEIVDPPQPLPPSFAWEETCDVDVVNADGDTVTDTRRVTRSVSGLDAMTAAELAELGWRSVDVRTHEVSDPAADVVAWNAGTGTVTVDRYTPRPAPTLTVDRPTITVGGSATPARFTFNDPAADPVAEVAWQVNDVDAGVDRLADGSASLDVTATAAGPIDVTAVYDGGTVSLVITATAT